MAIYFGVMIVMVMVMCIIFSFLTYVEANFLVGAGFAVGRLLRLLKYCINLAVIILMGGVQYMHGTEIDYKNKTLRCSNRRESF